MSNLSETIHYYSGYDKGFKEGLKASRPVINITVNISNLDKVTETERDLAEVTNVLNNYKSMLFGE